MVAAGTGFGCSSEIGSLDKVSSAVRVDEGTVILRATKTHDPEGWSPPNGDIDEYESPLFVEVPERISTVQGAAGDGWASLTYAIDGETTKCCYRGQAGEGYAFDRCGDASLQCADPSSGTVYGVGSAGCEAYADVRDHLSCEAGPGACEFYAWTDDRSCADVCGDRGGSCVDAFDNLEFQTASCGRGDRKGCDAALKDQVCVCTPPAPVASGPCTEASCAPGSYLEVDHLRLFVLEGDASGGPTEALARLDVLGDGSDPRCFGATGSDCLALQQDPGVPNRCGDGHLGAAAIRTIILDTETESWSECVADPHYRPRDGGRQAQAVTVGSLQHDQCCAENPGGLFCDGSPNFGDALSSIVGSLFPGDCGTYEDVSEHVSCGETDGGCEFYARTERQSCADVCGARGQACLDAYDNLEFEVPACGRGDQVGCDAELTDQICVCERPSSSFSSDELCAGELLRAARDATQDGRSWSGEFRIDAPVSYRILDADGNLTPEAGTLAAPFGTDVRRVEDGRYCRSGRASRVDGVLVGALPGPRVLCEPYVEPVTAEPPPPLPTSCERLGAGVDWVREGFSFTRHQSWVDPSQMEQAYASLVPSSPGDTPTSADLLGTYLQTQRYLEAALAASADTVSRSSCNRREVFAVRDGNGDIAGVAVVRNLPSEQEGGSPRTRFSVDVEAYATRADVYAPPMLDCLRAQLGGELLNLMRVQPAELTEAFWETQALRVEAERINADGSTYAWDSDGQYYFEAVCSLVDAPVSSLPLLGLGDETLAYEGGDDRVIQIRRRIDERELDLAGRQAMLNQLGQWGWPVAALEVAPDGVCAAAERYLANSLDEFADFEDDDLLDDFPNDDGIVGGAYCDGVDADEDGFEPGPAADGLGFTEILDSLEGDERCNALRSLARMYGGADQPRFDPPTPRGSAMWDFQAAVFPGGHIRVVDPRLVLVGRTEGTSWAPIPGIAAELVTPRRVFTVTEALANQREWIDEWWELLGGDEAFEDCGQCRSLGDADRPLAWASQGFELTVADSYVDPVLAEAAPEGVFAPFDPETPEYVAAYLDGLDVLSRRPVRNRGVLWETGGEIAGVAHVAIDPFATFPYSEVRLLGAVSPVDAARTVQCLLEELEVGRLVLAAKASPAPTRETFWTERTREVQDSRPELFASVDPDGRHSYEATCDAVDGRVTSVVTSPLGTPGSQVAAYVLPDEEAYRDAYGPRVLQLPNSYGNDFTAKRYDLERAASIGWPAGDLEVFSRGLCATTSRYQANSAGLDDFDGYLDGLEAEGPPRQCEALASIETMREALNEPPPDGSCIGDFQVGAYADGLIRVVDPDGVVTADALGEFASVAECQSTYAIEDKLDAWWERLGGGDAWDECRCGSRDPQDPSCDGGSGGAPYAFDPAAGECAPEGGCPPRYAPSGSGCVPVGTDENCASLGDSCLGGTVCRQLAGPGFPYGCRCPAGTSFEDGVCVSNLADASTVLDCSEFGEGFTFCPADDERPGRCVRLTEWSDCGACGLTCGGSKVCTEEEGPLGCACPPDLPRFNADTGVCEAEAPTPRCPPTFELDPAAGTCVPDDEAECCGEEWRDPSVGICCDDEWVIGETLCAGGAPPDGCTPVPDYEQLRRSTCPRGLPESVLCGEQEGVALAVGCGCFNGHAEFACRNALAAALGRDPVSIDYFGYEGAPALICSGPAAFVTGSYEKGGDRYSVSCDNYLTSRLECGDPVQRGEAPTTLPPECGGGS